jgi:nitrogen regulatory protein P-II 2
MKKIDAIIRQQNLDNVRECLTSIGVEGLTVMDVLGFGRQMGRTEIYRGCEYRVDFHPKLLLTILARDDKFYRGKNQRYRVQGTGMGLAIVKTIVDAHGGTIGVTSQLGCGSVFHIVLPMPF